MHPADNRHDVTYAEVRLIVELHRHDGSDYSVTVTAGDQVRGSRPLQKHVVVQGDRSQSLTSTHVNQPYITLAFTASPLRP